MADAPASKPTSARAIPAQAVLSQQTISQSTTTQAETVALGRHEIVRHQIAEVFPRTCSDAVAKIADSPVREKYHVFQDELHRLRDELGSVLCPACEAYTGLAVARRSEIGSDLLGWVQQHVKTDLAEVKRDRLEQWVRDAVGLDASLYPDLPAWIDFPARSCVLGRPLFDVDLGAALTDEEAEYALKGIWMRFRLDCCKSVAAAIQSARERLVESLSTSHNSKQVDRRPGPPGAIRHEQLNDHDLTMANRKLSDPSEYPYMTAREVAAVLGISDKTVYEHGGLEEVPTGTRKRLWSTASVIAVKNSPPR